MNKHSLSKTWTIISLLAVLCLSLGAADSASARGGCGCMNANLTPEQSAQLFDLRQQFMSDTAGLRKGMMVKRTEMTALWQSPTPDQNQIRSKQQEINTLRERLQGEGHVFSGAGPKDLPPSRHGGWTWPRRRHGQGPGLWPGLRM